MGQKSSKPTTNQQNFPILALPEDVITKIALFIMDTKSQLALAHTCTTAYKYHKSQKSRKETVAFLCSPDFDLNYKGQYCKALKRWLSETGWVTVKVALKEILIDSQSNNSYPIRALILDQSLQFPDELECESISALMVKFISRASFTLQNISFWEKLSNLKIISLSSIIIDENIVSAISKLDLLKTISLNHCEIVLDNFSRMLKACATVKEIELFDSFDMKFIEIPLLLEAMNYIIFPPQVRRLRIGGFYRPMEIDLSRCTRLQSL
jgi:hypothetical protein